MRFIFRNFYWDIWNGSPAIQNSPIENHTICLANEGIKDSIPSASVIGMTFRYLLDRFC